MYNSRGGRLRISSLVGPRRAMAVGYVGGWHRCWPAQHRVGRPLGGFKSMPTAQLTGSKQAHWAHSQCLLLAVRRCARCSQPPAPPAAISGRPVPHPARLGWT